MTDLNQVDIEQGKVDVEVFNQTDAALSLLAEKYSHIPDVNSKDGYEFVKAGVKELTGYRTTLDAERQRIKKPYLDAGRIIDNEAKRITAKLVELEEPMKAKKKEVDDRKKKQEEQRLARLREKVSAISGRVAEARGKTRDEIAKIIEDVDAIDTKRDYYDLTREAIEAQQATLHELSEMYNQQFKYEQAKLEEERLRKEQVAQREQQRITDKINDMRMLPADLTARPASEIEGNLKNLTDYDIPRDEFGNRYDEAQDARQKAMQQLEAMAKQARMIEEAQAKIEPEPEKTVPEKVMQDAVEKGTGTMKVGSKSAEHVKHSEIYGEATEEEDQAWAEKYGNDVPDPEMEPAPEADLPDVWTELSAWCDKWEISLQASHELNDILNRHL